MHTVNRDRLDRKKAKTKEAIFKAAVKLFLKKGYDETTVEEIAEKADVAKGTFFNYFPAKEAILVYLGQQRNAKMEEMLIKEIIEIISAKEKLNKGFQFLGEVNEAERGITALVVKMALSINAAAEKENLSNFKTILVEILEEGKRQGEFRGKLNSGRVADILMGVYFNTLLQWLGDELEQQTLSSELLARLEIILQGIEVKS